MLTDAKVPCDLLSDLLQKLGLTIRQKELEPPATSAVCLGVEINTLKGIVSIPEKEIAKITGKIRICVQNANCSPFLVIYCTSISASNLHVILNTMLQTLGSGHGQSRIQLDPE